jgi:hypothetical protein
LVDGRRVEAVRAQKPGTLLGKDDPFGSEPSIDALYLPNIQQQALKVVE